MTVQPPASTGTSDATSAPAAVQADAAGLCPEANPTSTPRAQRSVLERLIRQALLVENASPRAMFELKGSLVFTAIRCVLMYAVIPLVVPLVSWAGVLATPLSLLLGLAAIVLAISSLRRVWLADYRHRWGYTAFILVALGLLVMVVVIDVRTLLA
jgi:hypothetical protein